MSKIQLLPLLHQLYQATDRLSEQLSQQHANRLQCRRGCSACCMDELSVFSLEAENIRQHHSALLIEAAAHPEGACAFLDAEGACRIYQNRPLVCRTQGLPLSWIIEAEGAPAELRDICPLNEAGEPIEELPAEAVFPATPFEEKLALLQLHHDGGKLEREALRSLFRAQPSPKPALS